MKILKYKYLSNSKYKIILDDQELILYEDVITKNNILSKKEISEEEINKYLDENIYYELYYQALKYLKIRIRSRKEMFNYLKKYSSSNDLINKVIDRLEEEGYIDETIYARSYINDSILFKLDGPLKIKKYLLNMGISLSVVDQELDAFTEDICVQKINKYISKMVKLNKNNSVQVLKQKINQYLFNIGYSEDIINRCLENVSFSEEGIREKEYNKIYNKLSKKYSGKELDYKIKQKLYQKGFKQ